MRWNWKEFRTGWDEAAWGWWVIPALVPFALVGALAIEVYRGRVQCTDIPTWLWKLALAWMALRLMRLCFSMHASGRRYRLPKPPPRTCNTVCVHCGQRRNTVVPLPNLYLWGKPAGVCEDCASKMHFE